MIEFSIVPAENGLHAYDWHRRFAAEDLHIYPRSWEEFKAFAQTQQLWAARENNQYIGQAYCARENNVWEIGGLFVAKPYRNEGVAKTLAYLALAHLLYTVDPLSVGHLVITRVHEKNSSVDPLVNQLHLQRVRTVEKVRRGEKVFVVEYQLAGRTTVQAVVSWCESWTGHLEKGIHAEINLSPGVTLNTWASALRDMAEKMQLHSEEKRR
jgi:GNAT superfamily N-acetyltransferase